MSWWHEAVVYEVYPRSFQDSDGDGVGDLRGLTQRLDHLAWLGVGGLWLCPVYPSPQRDNGYDVSDLCGVDPLFGTLDDLDALVAAAHERGIRVVLDLVLNHTSDAHPWLRQHPERYVWRPPRPGCAGGAPGSEPTNWGAAFGGSAWTWDAGRGAYRLGIFSPWQPDLDWSRPETRAALADVLRFWRAREIDGFRLDVITLVDKPDVLRDGPVGPGSGYADAVAACAGGPRLAGYLRELRAAAGDALLIGEAPGTTPEGARVLTTDGGLDLVLQFEHAELDREPARWRRRPLDLRDLKAWAARWQRPDAGWPALFLGNHDQARIASRYGAPDPWTSRSAAMWAVLLHAHRGTPFLYQGDEIGMTNRPVAGPEDLVDVEARTVLAAAVAGGADPAAVLDGLRALGRDHARVPVSWDDGLHGGFTAGTPWLAAHPEARHRNVAAQRDDPCSVLRVHRDLVALRRTEPALAHGDTTVLLPDDPVRYALLRRRGEVELLLVANVSSTEAPWPTGGATEGWADAAVLLSTRRVPPDGPRPAAADDPGPAAPLAPWEARLLRRVRSRSGAPHHLMTDTLMGYRDARA
ncbi:glucohydrolase [Cellulomonas hominis]|uniref:Glucohydrolase n=1 Tax=Cellulomonas hominis TaxID=156981 RepID=A0A511F7F0_9CELL|nr:alpha-glucosidase [Cellulomonas hominis]MBB5474050.1 oligo-1,6-glucosidase [Cellulomonas hominis]GEL45155.1 glucohydrolase [Cellulomonas hominis]